MSKQDINNEEALLPNQPLSLDLLIEQQQASPVSSFDEISSLWPADDDPNLLLEYLLKDRAERRRLDSESESAR
jgi:hypothetical protein